MDTMTSRERVLCALKGGEPDTVPIFDFIYSRVLYKEVNGRIPSHYCAEDVMECSARIGYDLGVIPFGGFGGLSDHQGGGNTYTDEWGTRFEKREDTWPVDAPVDFPLKDRSDLKNYSWPDPTRPERTAEARTALRMARDHKMAVFGNVRGPFSATWFLVGVENFMMKMFDDPEFIDDVVTRCTEFFIEGGRKMAEAGVDALVFADDYGSNTGPLMSPEHFRRYIFPHTQRMVNEFKRLGVPVIMHSDGNLNLLMDDLVDMGIDGYHPVERASQMNIAQVKTQYGDRVCLLGNVDNVTTLVSGSPQDVDAEVKQCIRIAAPGGGHILCSDHSLHDDITNENVFALYDAGRRYGRYPIRIDS